MNTFDSKQPLTNPSDIEPVIAGTLILMTQYQLQRRPCMAARIGSNLELLATCEHLSPPFRTLCERLQNQWVATFNESQTTLADAQREGLSLH